MDGIRRTLVGTEILGDASESERAKGREGENGGACDAEMEMKD